jgi:N-acetyl-anhydromuramyl-L-alanine amidase AmpD
MSKPVVLPPLKRRLSPNVSQRLTPISLVVMHDTEGAYEGACSWLCNPQAQASAHVVLREDGNDATQLVRFAEKAWACEAFNSMSLNLELAGFAAKGYQDHQLRVAARIVANWCHQYTIPATLSNGLRPGITFHELLGVAGGGHHDPGFSQVQMIWFVALVKSELKRGGFLPHWGET